VEQHFREAIRLRPSSADAHLRYAAFLRSNGRLEESRREALTALRLDPLTIHTHVQLVILDLTERHYEEAIVRSRRLAEINSDVFMARFLFARCLIAIGDFERAIAELARLGPGADRPPAITLRGYALGRLGRLDEARGVLNALEAMLDTAPDASIEYDLAVVHLGMGEGKKTLEHLDRAIDQRDIRVRLIGHEPMFESLWSDAQFGPLLRRAGLPSGLKKPGSNGANASAT
jgi:tetratricopeptide (TPR) repeat protein